MNTNMQRDTQTIMTSEKSLWHDGQLVRGAFVYFNKLPLASNLINLWLPSPLVIESTSCRSIDDSYSTQGLCYDSHFLFKRKTAHISGSNRNFSVHNRAKTTSDGIK